MLGDKTFRKGGIIITNLRHLHVHTPYSLLDGFCRIDKLIEKVKILGMDSIAITDHGNVYGIIDFYKQCKEAGIKPIIGLETYVVPNLNEHIEWQDKIAEHKKEKKKMTAKEKNADSFPTTVKDAFNKQATSDERYFGNSEAFVNVEGEIESYKFKISHLLLLAKNQTGYKNLLKIASIAELKGFYYKPRVDMETLRKYGEGIIATSACRGGEIPRLILRGRLDLAEQLAKDYAEVFDEFYLEIQPSQNNDQLMINEALIGISKKLNIPLVVTTDAHYVNLDESHTHDVLLAVSTGASMEDEDRLRFDEAVNYIMTEQEILRYGIPQEAIDNTKAIADKCNVEIELGKVYFPHVDIPEGYTPRQYIDNLCYTGLFERYNKWPKKKREEVDLKLYQDRLKYELDVIEEKGFIDYFLIVRDFIHYAKNHNIYIGPGRGSAAGCMASYCLKITNLDPIQYDLLFERFLNPERMEYPDIDSDIEEYIDVPELFISGRQRVIEYLTDKYGSENMCQVLALGTMGTRSVLKDVGRALGIDHNEINDRATKFVPADNGQQWPLADCLYGEEEHGRDPVPEIVEYAREQPELFEIALGFQGIPRHTSIHAAGVAISPVPITEILPLCLGGNGEIVSQVDKNKIEELGLLKMDLLGLRTLGVMHKCVDYIKQRHGITIDLDDIDLEDQGAMRLIKAGDTAGIFQIESDGMTNIFKQMNTVDFESIIVTLSLYRPGPMQMIPQYIACKNGYTEPEYLIPELEPILKNTFGVIVYQEQVIRIAQDLAGFSAGAADKFRKAVGKKNEKLIKEQIDLLIYGNENDAKAKKIIPGLLKNGIPYDKAVELGRRIVSFAKYAFNRSHSAGYAVITSQTAYLKAHYTLEFLAPLISSYIGKASKSGEEDKISYYINKAKASKITILPPDINKSGYEFLLEGSAIRYGLGAIKGLNKSAIAIVREREANSDFTSIEDFLSRFGKREVNKKTIDSLVLSGALDSVSKEKDRLKILETIYELRGDKYDPDTIDKFISEEIVDVEGAKQYFDVNTMKGMLSDMKQMRIEQVLLGTYISGHPLDGVAQPIDWEREECDGNTFTIIGIISSVKKIKTRKKDDMAFVQLEVLEGFKDITLFPKDYELHKNKLDIGGIREITVQCKRRKDDPSQTSLIVKNIKYYRGENNE